MFAKSCRAWSGFGDWKAKGKALPRSCKFKYLGVELHDVTGTKGSMEHRLSCMIGAHSAVSRRLNKKFYHHWRLLKGEAHQFSGMPLPVPLPAAG